MSEADRGRTLKEWRERSQTGTSCKCGAHANVPWGEGGEDWLIAHVAEAHRDAFDWRAAVKRALTLPTAEETVSELRLLVEGE